jgi:hypothetical protein
VGVQEELKNKAEEETTLPIKLAELSATGSKQTIVKKLSLWRP